MPLLCRLLICSSIAIAFSMSLIAPCLAQTEETYAFSYDFQSGAQLTGTFLGRPSTLTGPFADTIVVLPDTTIATFDTGTGDTFSWDTTLSDTVLSSQVGNVDLSENGFVSLDGSRLDLALSAGVLEPGLLVPDPFQQVVLENGIQDGGLRNNVATINLPFGDVAEEFIPANWTLSVATAVPEPGSASLVLAVMVVCGLRRSRG